jgi:hypothetical protein
MRRDQWVSSLRSSDGSEDNGSDDDFLHVLSPWLSDDSRCGDLMKLGRRRDIAAKKRQMPFANLRPPGSVICRLAGAHP